MGCMDIHWCADKVVTDATVPNSRRKCLQIALYSVYKVGILEYWFHQADEKNESANKIQHLILHLTLQLPTDASCHQRNRNKENEIQPAGHWFQVKGLVIHHLPPAQQTTLWIWGNWQTSYRKEVVTYEVKKRSYRVTGNEAPTRDIPQCHPLPSMDHPNSW